jgi:chromosome segregation ATPase
MTNNNDRTRWDDARLDQLATAVDALREQAESNTRNVDILVGIVTGHQQRVTNAEERIATLFEEIRDIKVEIRGLQTENRRILDHLFGRAARMANHDQ